MKVLITGASGFLGSHIAARLSEAGMHVVGASRGMGHLCQVEGVEWRYLDISSPDSVGAFDFAGFDVVVHNAGITFSRREERYFRVNYLGTRFLVKRLEDVGFRGRFIYISSLAVHGPGEAVEESLELLPITPYGVSKCMGELEVRASGLNWYVLRPPVIFGERDRALVGAYRLFSKGLVPVWTPPKRLSLVYARNVAEAVRFLIGYEGTHRVFLIKDTTATWEELAVKIQEIMGVRSKVKVPLRNWMVDVAKPLVGLLKGILKVPVDRHKLEEIKAREWVVRSNLIFEEGFTPLCSFEEGLRRTLLWCKERGYL